MGRHSLGRMKENGSRLVIADNKRIQEKIAAKLVNYGQQVGLKVIVAALCATVALVAKFRNT